MSEDVISQMLTIAGPLLGVFVGGLLTFITARCLERQRWRHERQEKLLILQRDAISAALEWIEPMRNAEIRASSMVMAAIRGNYEHELFLKEYPDLLGELVKKDLTASQRAVLPDDISRRGNHIIHEMDQLRYLGIKYGKEATVMGQPLPGFQECSTKLDIIGKEITCLNNDLGDMFRRTYE